MTLSMTLHKKYICHANRRRCDGPGPSPVRTCWGAETRGTPARAGSRGDTRCPRTPGSDPRPPCSCGRPRARSRPAARPTGRWPPPRSNAARTSPATARRGKRQDASSVRTRQLSGRVNCQCTYESCNGAMWQTSGRVNCQCTYESCNGATRQVSGRVNCQWTQES